MVHAFIIDLNTFMAWVCSADPELERRRNADLSELLPPEMTITITPLIYHRTADFEPLPDHVHMAVAFEDCDAFMLDIPLTALGPDRDRIIIAAVENEAAAIRDAEAFEVAALDWGMS